ncbi:MAG: preprotein translocase subunit SecY [Oscillospiraceae bacterium]|nr:preprotein translocase subunit SecY [Oscillospiraceae bacterium]MDD6085757.1 preprotein translocase subunit SecY [Oscillospiraceae bacterium]MDY3257614.1 preprotein translocase subunit SecY [Ruminococcus callidus]
MFKTMKNAWQVPEIRKKLLYTLFIIIIFRIGSVITVPFLDTSVVSDWMKESATGGNFLEYLNIITGGALSKATIFSLSITPYINASIIIQLLTYAIPPLERLSQEGETGRKILNKITAYVAVGLSAFMSFAYYLTLKNSMGAVKYTTGGQGVFAAFVIILSLIAGTSIVVWLGNRVDNKGIGNGISIILFAGIIARFPTDVGTLVTLTKETPQKYFFVSLGILVLFIAMIAFIVFMNASERRIPIQYAKRVVGRKQYGGQSSHIPVKVCMSGVMPIIFAMSFMSLPSTLALFKQPVADITAEGVTGGQKFYYHFIHFFSTQSYGYAVLYFILIIAFNYFYVAMQYNPIEIANNLRQNNGGIPGIRPGKPTSDFIQRVLSKITLVGAFFLGVIAILPIFLTHLDSNLSSLSMGGTSILIVVSVAIETVRTLESHLMMRHHKGFLE